VLGDSHVVEAGLRDQRWQAPGGVIGGVLKAI
jgi:hypothetical protein